MRYPLLITALLLYAGSLPNLPSGLFSGGLHHRDAGSAFVVLLEDYVKSPGNNSFTQASLNLSARTFPVSRSKLIDRISSYINLPRPGEMPVTLSKARVYHAVGFASGSESPDLVHESADTISRFVSDRRLPRNLVPQVNGSHPPCVRDPTHPRCISTSGASSTVKSTGDVSRVKSNDILTGNTIVIVIDDFGYRNDTVLDGFMDLNERLTYAVIPGHTYSVSTASIALERGFEVLIHMPMEALGPAPGELEYRLKLAMSSDEIRRRMRVALRTLPMAAGVNNHQGSAATGDKRVMGVVGSELKRADKFFLDSITSARSVAEVTMKIHGVPTAHRDVFLDNYDDVDYIRQQVYILADIARSQGFAVGIGHVRYKTLLVLREAIPSLKEDGFEFAYVSQVVR